MIRSQIVLLFVLAAASFAGSLPNILGFDRFAFGDEGWALTVDEMLDEGQKPVTDFGYFYGLLTLLIDRALFAAAGRTPEAVAGLYAACALLVTVGIARTMVAAKLDRVSAAFLAVCAAYMVMPIFYPSPAHAVEAALLAHAIAFHAGGRPGRALALVTVAVFVKPSLAYVYGLILLVLILAGWPTGTGRLKRLIPATVAGVAILGTLIATFGWDAVVKTQLPFGAMKSYEESGFGFVNGSGRQFWLPDPPKPPKPQDPNFYLKFYLLTPATVWLLSSVFLVAAALRLLPHARRPAASATIACAVLHLVFVFVLFGNQWSWIYYPYILFVGAAVGLSEWNRIALERTQPAAAPPAPPAGGEPPAAEEEQSSGPLAPVGMILLVLAALGQVFSIWVGYADLWRTVRRSPVTAGLWFHPDKIEDWAAVRQAAKTGRVFVLTKMGCPHLLAPEVDCPRTWCLARATVTPAELDRVRRGLAAAEWVVVPVWHDNDLMDWPELADAVKPFHEFKKLFSVTVYRRQHPQ